MLLALVEPDHKIGQSLALVLTTTGGYSVRRFDNHRCFQSNHAVAADWWVCNLSMLDQVPPDLTPKVIFYSFSNQQVDSSLTFFTQPANRLFTFSEKVSEKIQGLKQSK